MAGFLLAGCAKQSSAPALSSAEEEQPAQTAAAESTDGREAARQAAREAVFGKGASSEESEAAESESEVAGSSAEGGGAAEAGSEAAGAPAEGAEGAKAGSKVAGASTPSAGGSSGGASIADAAARSEPKASGGAAGSASTGGITISAAGERQLANASPVPGSFFFRQSFAAGLDANRDPRVPTGKIVSAREIEIEDGKTQCTPLEIGSAAGFALLGPPGMILAMAITKFVAPNSVPAAEYAVVLDGGRTITVVRPLAEDETPLAEGLEVVVALEGRHPALIPAAAYSAPDGEPHDWSRQRPSPSDYDRRPQTTPLF